MSLSSLPLEILGDIIDRVVNNRLGIRGSAHLRLVSRTFDLEIRRSYARTSQFKSDRRFAAAPHSPSKCAFFAKYLLLRPHGKGEAEDADISYFLNDLVDQLLGHEQDGTATTESEEEDASRYRLLSLLCSNVNTIHLTGYPSPVKRVNGSTAAMDLLIAAIYTDRLTLVNQMLQTDQINFQTDTSALFETPLLAAVETQNPDTVRALLAHNAPFEPPNTRPSRPFRTNPLLAAVRKNDLPILAILLDPSSNLCKTDLTYQHALVSSINSSPDPHATTSLLISHYPTAFSESPYILCKGLRAACRAGNTELITILLDSGADVNSTMNHRATHFIAAPIAQAAWTGQVPSIHLLLSRGATLYPNPDANTGVRTQHPGADALRAATWGNHWPAARALLDAGVAQHLSQSDWCSVFKIAALHADCVDVAANLLDCDVVRLDGLAEDEVASEDAVVELVAIVCQRGNVGFMRALVRHGCPVTGHAMYERAMYPIPIIQALAWEQQGVVRLLEEVAGQKVNEEMVRMADEYREREMARGWSRVAAPKCGMPAYTILR